MGSFISFMHVILYTYLSHSAIGLLNNTSFEFRLRIALGAGGDLSLTSRIRNTNTDGRPFSYTFAYHTYFAVSDIRYVAYLFRFFVLCILFDNIFYLCNQLLHLLTLCWKFRILFCNVVDYLIEPCTCTQMYSLCWSW